MNTKFFVILLAFVISTSIIGTVSAGSLNITTPDYGMVGEVVTVGVYSGGVLEGADVYFVLDESTPIHGQTDIDGAVSYKAQLPGRLKITAKFMGERVSKEIPIYEVNFGVKLIVDGVTEEEMYTDETATYLILVENTGNTTDTLEIAIKTGIGSLNKSSLTLPAGASEEVLLSVSDSTIGEYSTTVTASSKGDPSKVDDITVMTEVKSRPSSGSTGNTTPTGGGGGGGLLPAEIQTDSNGIVQSTYTEESSDGKAKLTIPKGTMVFDADGKPLKSVSISSTQLGGTILAYNLGPDGATFDPKVTLIFEFDPSDVPVGKTVVIKVYDGTEWISLETTVDTSTNTATAKVSHFSVFALFGEPKHVIGSSMIDQIPESTATAIPAHIDETPVVSQPAEETPAIPWIWLMLIMLAIAVIVIGAAYYRK